MKTREEVYKELKNSKYCELMIKEGKKVTELLESHITLWGEVDSLCDCLKDVNDMCVREANIYAVKNTERIYRCVNQNCN